LSDYEEEQVLYPATIARPRTPYASAVQIHDREISWVASPGPL
jgi:serine/arginine repetitive matrix protein 2